MYTILLGIFGGFFTGLLMTAYDDFTPGVIAFGMLPIMGGIVGSTLVLIIGIVGADKSDFKKVRSEKQLVSLQSSVNTSGNLFLGTGTLQGVKKYYYYVKTEKGTVSRSVHADNTYIREFAKSSAEKPRIVKVRYKRKPNPWYFAARIPTKLNDYNVIYIPEGSIKQEYKPN